MWYEPFHEISRVPLDSLLVEQDIVAEYAKKMGSKVDDWFPLEESHFHFHFGSFYTPYSPPTPTSKLTPGSMISKAEMHTSNCDVNAVRAMMHIIIFVG